MCWYVDLVRYRAEADPSMDHDADPEAPIAEMDAMSLAAVKGKKEKAPAAPRHVARKTAKQAAGTLPQSTITTMHRRVLELDPSQWMQAISYHIQQEPARCKTHETCTHEAFLQTSNPRTYKTC